MNMQRNDIQNTNNNIFRIYNRVLSTYKIVLTHLGVFVVILSIILLREMAKISATITNNNNDESFPSVWKTSNFIEAIMYTITSLFIYTIVLA